MFLLSTWNKLLIIIIIIIIIIIKIMTGNGKLNHEKRITGKGNSYP